MKARETAVGSTPVLGKNTLAGITDSNGYVISENQQKKYLNHYGKLEIQYCTDDAAGKTESGTEQWKHCNAAGI